MKKQNKNDYKIKVNYNEDSSAPTFTEILESDEFKEIVKRLLYDNEVN